MEDMLHHTRAVARASQRSGGRGHAVHVVPGRASSRRSTNAGRFIQEGGADAVKLEGGERVAPAITSACVEIGIPVMGHLGLTPQSVLAFGGYKVQARGEADQERLIARGATARGVRAASRWCSRAFRRASAPQVSRELTIPTIGIGAGAGVRRPGAGEPRPARSLPRPHAEVRAPLRATLAGHDARSVRATTPPT